MGRGRGKGKRLTAVPSHDDPGSGGEEVIPTYKRRGRPQKPLKDDLDEEVAEKIELEGGADSKVDITSTDIIAPIIENGKKRKRQLQVKERSDSLNDENSAGTKSKMDDTTKSNNFRQNGNRRKSTPRRAAEAGVECLLD